MTSRKIILVTGANQGIGFDTSYALAAASPSNHVIMGCRSPDRGAKALQELQARIPIGTLSLVQLDVTDEASIRAAVHKITRDFGVLDVLVNNAGIVITEPRKRRDELLDTLNTNAASPVIVTEEFLPLLQKSQDPRIINVTSRLGSINERADPNGQYYTVLCEAYRMSKAALNMATVCMYAAYKTWGAKVWAFCPGHVVSNLTGEEGRKQRIAMGLDSSETSAQGILEIVEGQRDAEVGLFLQRRGLRAEW
ncbi:hypothetical protein BDV59DRAFT_175758 [Aspergillus ambiguus]|uniref:uncharacterized protein n=1 Tax=Aspergillus ambiguus TaxID=176160 RepID=UPI003CCE14DD